MIEVHEIEAVQNSWGQALIHVGQADTWDEAYERALELVESHYLLTGEPLLFCPTKAAERQFRGTRKDAVSYFVGQDPDHPEDQGFALEPWHSVRFENAGLVCREGLAMVMGNYFFGRADGTEQKVEYSFVYVRNENGALRIQLHHSALPYPG